jgi:hypothetical protein
VCSFVHEFQIDNHKFVQNQGLERLGEKPQKFREFRKKNKGAVLIRWRIEKKLLL